MISFSTDKAYISITPCFLFLQMNVLLECFRTYSWNLRVLSTYTKVWVLQRVITLNIHFWYFYLFAHFIRKFIKVIKKQIMKYTWTVLRHMAQTSRSNFVKENFLFYLQTRIFLSEGYHHLTMTENRTLFLFIMFTNYMVTGSK